MIALELEGDGKVVDMAVCCFFARATMPTYHY